MHEVVIRERFGNVFDTGQAVPSILFTRKSYEDSLNCFEYVPVKSKCNLNGFFTLLLIVSDSNYGNGATGIFFYCCSGIDN